MENLVAIHFSYRGLSAAFVFTLLSFFGGFPLWSQTFQTLYSFKVRPDGNHPEAGLVADSNGALYGTTFQGGNANLGSVFQLVQQNGVWVEIPLHDFTCCTDGENPYGVILDKKGNLFGVAYEGQNGCGAVYEVSPAGNGQWTETVLHSFTELVDGCAPFGSLTTDKSGALYGTTSVGGPGGGEGTIYKLSPPTKQGGAWRFKILYTFPLNGPGVCCPEAELIFDKHGALYGTGEAGGPNEEGGVFKLTPPQQKGGTWTETDLYTFTGTADGGQPQSGLVFDKSGNLYGNARIGGMSSGCVIYTYQCGVIFELTPNGSSWTESVLHSFTGENDGAQPVFATMVFDKKGNLYGVTNIGGEPQNCYNQGSGCGVVFKLRPPTKKGGIGRRRFSTHS
jgi:uncharacterized repeat protein (TIGR03803 family)